MFGLSCYSCNKKTKTEEPAVSPNVRGATGAPEPGVTVSRRKSCND